MIKRVRRQSSRVPTRSIQSGGFSVARYSAPLGNKPNLQRLHSPAQSAQS